MKTALVICDNEVLNSIYSVNLKTYTELNLIFTSSLDEALIHIEDTDIPIDLLVTMASIGDEDTALLAFHNLIENDRDIPSIVIGEGDLVPDENYVVKNQFDIPGILQNIFECLKITPREVLAVVTEELYEMPIRLFFPFNKAFCDTYYMLENDGVKTPAKIYDTDSDVWPKVREFLDQNVSHLLIPARERFAFTKRVTELLIESMEKVTPETPQQESLDFVEQSIDAIAEQLFEDEGVTKEVVQLSQMCMDTMEEVIDSVPDLKSILKDLAALKSGFLYSHSIIAGYVSSHILENVEWGGPAHKEKLKFVLYFHDMYLVQVYKKYPDLMYEDKIIFDPQVSEEDKEIIINHAAEAADAIRRYPACPLGADVIIMQHHGTSNGLGFATSFKDDISPLAKVLIIAEAFTEEIYQRIEDRQKINVEDVITKLRERFTKHTYKKIIETLATIKI
ncbi:hypothetical protein ABMA79_10095 [Halobacteriovorax sp. HFRX-2_2]|uniref:hypothetical protein n=1 Tax=unclassified Halobacteriovorax TaxID=2639665 RepID=UPI003716F0AB